MDDLGPVDLELVVLYFAAEFRKRSSTSYTYPLRIHSAIRARVPGLRAKIADVITAVEDLVDRGELDRLASDADVPDAVREYRITALGAERLGNFQLPSAPGIAQAG